MDKENREIGTFIVGVILFILFLYVGISYMEMRAFNKFSEQKASLVDALFAELRIFAE